MKKTSPKKNPILVFALGVAVTLIVIGVLIYAGTKSQLPSLPVSVTYRKALTGQGYVIGIHNSNNQALALKVTLQNPTFKNQKTFTITLDPFAIKEIGHLEGWIGAVGDTIKVESSGFSSYEGSIPP